MKFYEFVDGAPEIGRLLVIEGTERVLADRALDLAIERLLPPEVRELNLSRFRPEDTGDFGRLREAINAMPFLAEHRVVVATDAQELRADARRALLAAGGEVPEGNTLAIVDLTKPQSKKPQSLGALAGRSALRVDTTASEETRQRFVRETLAELGAQADPRAIGALARSQADLASVRNDLEKLALAGKKIGVADLEREAFSIDDPKTYKYAGALLGGSVGDALRIAHECFAATPRNAAIPLLSAAATECGYVFELTRSGGSLPEWMRFREGALRAVARRAGADRVRRAHRHALQGIEAIVTGNAGSDPSELRTLVERVSVEIAALLA